MLTKEESPARRFPLRHVGRRVLLWAMKSARAQRVFVIGVAAAIAVGWLCAAVLWCGAFGSSGESSLLTVAAAMLAVMLALGVPRWAIRLGRRFSPAGSLEDLLAASKGSPSGPGGATMKKLLALAAVVAAASIPLEAALVGPGGSLAAAVDGAFLWSAPASLAASLAVRVACLLPMALATAMALLALTLVRGGWGRDQYSGAFSDLLLGLALAAAAFGGAWWAGLDLLGLSMVMAVGLLAAGAAMVTATASTARSGSAVAEQGNPASIFRRDVWPAFAAGLLTLAVQQRMMSDVLGLGEAPQMLWFAATLAATAAFLKGQDRQSHAMNRCEIPAVAVGLTCGLVFQTAAVLLCVWRGEAFWPCVVLAAAIQVPLAALAATVFSRQRRSFAQAGGTARAYLARACGGSAAGVLAYLGAAHLHRGLLVLLAMALGAMTLAVIAAIMRSDRWRQQLRWAFFGAAVLVAATAGIVTAARETTRQFDEVAMGAWLSAGRVDRDDLPAYLPMPPRRLSAAVTDALLRTLARVPRGGLWRQVGLGQDLPQGQGLLFETMPLDDSLRLAVAGRGRGEGAVGGPARQYDGALVTMLPADHPQAWRCYNVDEMSRVVRRVHAGGPVLLRTQCRGSCPRAALAVAATFLAQMGGGWAAIAFEDDDLDMLLCGPHHALPPPNASAGMVVLSLEELVAGPATSPIWTLRAPGRVGAALPAGFDLRRHIAQAAGP